MQTSVLRFPKADRFVTIYESLMVACHRNSCAAALITFFEGWHNFKLEQKPYTALYNDMADAAQVANMIDISGWQYHTDDQLKAGAMIFSIEAINEALLLLEDLEFISTDVPEHLGVLYDTQLTRWFLLRADRLNEWLDGYEKANRPKAIRIVPQRTRKARTVSNNDEAREVFKYWKVRLKHERAIADPQRLKLINERLGEGFTVIDLCMAIEGCVVSPFHQGDNDRKKVYDNIQLLFRSATYTEQFIGYAHAAQVKPDEIAERLAAKTIEPAKPLSGAPDKRRIESIVSLTLPFLLTDEALNDTNALRPLRVLLDNQVAIYSQLEQQLIDRVEATEGIWTIDHAARLEILIGKLKQPA